MRTRAPISFFVKLRLLPGLVTDLARIAGPLSRDTMKFMRQHGRKPTEKEMDQLIALSIQKTKLFESNNKLFFHIIGLITVTWAHIEHRVDLVNAISITRANGAKLAARLPLSLKPKLALFKRSFDRLDKLAKFKQRGLEIHDELMNLREFRHDFAHGIASEKLPSPREREIIRHSYHGAKLLQQTRIYSLKEMVEQLERMTEIAKTLTQLLIDIDAVLPKDVFDDTSR